MQAARSPLALRTNDCTPVCIQPIKPILVQEVQVCTSLPLPCELEPCRGAPSCAMPYELQCNGIAHIQRRQHKCQMF